MKKREIIIFAIILLAAAIVLLVIHNNNNEVKKAAVITVDGQEYKRIPLDDKTNMEFTIETEHGYNNVVIKNGVVNVVSADCPNQVCVNTKEASQIYDMIVCLPHKVMIEIVAVD